MTRRLFCAFLVVLLCSGGHPNSVFAEKGDVKAGEKIDKKSKPQRPDPAAEVAAIRETSQAFAAAFNKADAKAVAALWTEDGDYTDDAGRTVVGRAAIEKEYKVFLSAHAGRKLRVTVDAVKLLSDTAAVEDGRVTLDPPPPGAPAMSKYTAVHVKVDGRWLMSTVRDTRVETPSGYRNVADLEWLIGTWTAEEHGAKTESVCRWIANKSFVERSYTVTRADGVTTTGLQLIGWNPLERVVQSWNFSSDGGHAIGVWTPRERGWSAEIRGLTGDGIATTSVNLLTKLDENAYAWQSVQRTAGGTTLPDTEEIVLKRRPAGR